MPRLKIKKKSYRNYDKHHIEQLLTGYQFFIGTGFGNELRGQHDEKAMRSAWEKLRDQLLGPYIALNPGRRPFAWWKYDAPAMREYDGTCVAELEDAPEHLRNVRWFGINPILWGPCFHDPPAWEAQWHYLKRHGLLSETEWKWLQEHGDEYDDDAADVKPLCEGWPV